MWEKKLICQKREEVKYAKEKLCDFGRHFVDNQGLPVPVSTLSDILKEKDKCMSYVCLPTSEGSGQLCLELEGLVSAVVPRYLLVYSIAREIYMCTRVNFSLVNDSVRSS